MIFFIIFGLIGFGGVGYVITRHRADLALYANQTEHTPTFAHFMDDMIRVFGSLWHTHMREQLLVFTEKQLRWVRILVLRVERLLFHATHRVRDASTRNSDVSVGAPTSLGDRRSGNQSSEKHEDSLQ